MNRIKSRRPGNGSFSGKNRTAKKNNSSGRNNKRKTSTLDPGLLVNKVVRQAEEVQEEQGVSFNDMPLDPRLLQNLVAKGYEYPTQIQRDTWEPLLAGRDLMGIAKTGTGKTAAFLIPLIEQMLNHRQHDHALVVVPTRELALQVEDEFRSLSKGMGLRCSSFIGGTSVSADLKKLRNQNHVLIGTPGRLLDLIQRRVLNLENISTLVLDEFDRMLDMGFVNDINRMVELMYRRKQTILFSATMDKTQDRLISDLLSKPVKVRTQTTISANNQIEQDVIRVKFGEDKFNLLLGLLEAGESEKVLIFAETKRLVDRISTKLNRVGVGSDQIHGDKSQNYRVRALNKFKNGKVKVLVATDVAARGIDVSDITHVINYQLPMTYESYIHRIGRTGRAGKTGKALTFVD